MQRIRLTNTAFEGRNTVYLLGLDGDGAGGPITLIDTGVAVPSVREQLVAGLADAGIAPGDVERVLLTHWHADHAGLAGWLQAEAGATVHVHEDDAGMVDGTDRERYRDRQVEWFRRWGIPDDERRELISYIDSKADRAGRPPDVTPFGDGATFTVGDRDLEAIHLPGHAAGLSGFVDRRPDGPEAYVGDALLPKYTPNVGGADVRVESPVETYLTSLRRLIGADLHRAWPGHRGGIDAPTRRAATIMAHHRERTDRVLGVLRDLGPVDAWTVSAELFGDLAGIHVMHGPGEADAHLDHLVGAGLAVREGDRYRGVEADEATIEATLARMTPADGRER